MICPKCHSSTVVKNGNIHNGKPKFSCKDCGRQFVEKPENTIPQDKKFGSPVKSSGVSHYDRQGSVIVMNKVPNSPDVLFYSF